MGILNKQKMFEKILKLKFAKQTKEVKDQIQKLQQKIDEFTSGTNK